MGEKSVKIENPMQAAAAMQAVGEWLQEGFRLAEASPEEILELMRGLAAMRDAGDGLSRQFADAVKSQNR